MNILFFAVMAAVGGVIFVNGWTDAPTAIATCVTAGAMKERRAALMAAVCNLLGIAVSGLVRPAVAMTIKGMVHLPEDRADVAMTALLCALASVGLWAVTAWWFGIPTSESHGLLAGLTGAALAVGGVDSVDGEAWLRVILGLLISIGGGLLAGFLCSAVLSVVIQRRGRRDDAMKWGLRIGAAAMALLHGAQDGQKFLGIWLLAMTLQATESIPISLLIFLCAVFMGAGTLVGGGRIIRTLGEKLVKVGTEEGIAADAGAAVCLALLTLFGIPVSTTHTKTAALMGVGAAGRERMDWRVAGRMVGAWLLTFPVCGGAAYLGMRVILHLLGCY